MKTIKPKAQSIQVLIEKEIPVNQCWIDPILPRGGLLLFGGLAKTGKSHVLNEIARALSTGTKPFDCKFMDISGPCKTLLIEQEVGENGLQKRIKQTFANEDPKIYAKNLFYVSKVPEMQLDSAEGREILYDLVDDIKPNVLILDPIGRCHSYDENKSDQIQQLFTNLELLIKVFSAQQMSIIISHHAGKPSTDPNSMRDPLDPYNFRGSSKFVDCPDTLITMQKLKYLATPHKAWNIKMRFETRQDAGLPDSLLSINRDDDLRVRFEKIFDDTPAPIKKLGGGDSTKAVGKKQLRFAEA